jgi:hypothetical protein
MELQLDELHVEFVVLDVVMSSTDELLEDGKAELLEDDELGNEMFEVVLDVTF